MDNWQEYFEIREYLGSSIATNDFGEPTKYFYSVYTLFAVKEEWAENVVSCDVVIEYDADSSPKNISFNAKDMTFEITGDCENEFIPDDYLDSSRFTRGATAKGEIGLKSIMDAVRSHCKSLEGDPVFKDFVPPVSLDFSGEKRYTL